MNRRNLAVALLTLLVAGCAVRLPEPAPPAAWTFAVSGDSRNCGNLVMPAIARSTRGAGDRFYWHLGDLRRTSAADEDLLREPRFRAAPPSKREYQDLEWPDFLAHQVEPFGDLPFFLGIGNHETVAPKTREEFKSVFAALLDRPEIRATRQADEARLGAVAPRGVSTYYHWAAGGVDFINLDNANDSFDAAQLAWFDALVAADLRDPAITTLVVGMHEALPHSLGDNHSMCSSGAGIASGEHVYRKLVEAEAAKKRIYVLASHSHFFLGHVFDTPWWRDPAHGARPLPGWIVGTAGAVRYPLPQGVVAGSDALTHVYGYLRGTVSADGQIAFAFQELGEGDLQQARGPDYTAEDAAFCFRANPEPERLGTAAPDPACAE
jgi:hypothetical protein